MISVVIATRNRGQKVLAAINSILQSTYQKFEIIIIDQSQKRLSKNELPSDKRVHYFLSKTQGKSKALNKGLSYCKGEIIAFTDDDCVVDKNWLQEINLLFSKHRDVTAIFGQVFPYLKSQHNQLVCPCTVTIKKEKIYNYPVAHWKKIGFGNNMAVRARFFAQHGTFKTWLGPGSIGSNAEDAEVSFRLLINGEKILASPRPVVYHNKWITPLEERLLYRSYAAGAISSYGYYAFQGNAIAKKVVQDTLIKTYKKLRGNVISLRYGLKIDGPFYEPLIVLLIQVRMLGIALIFSLKDKRFRLF